MPLTTTPARNVLGMTLALLTVLLWHLPSAAAAGEFPDSMYYFKSQGAAIKKTRELEGKPAPALQVRDWNGKPQNLARLKGKVVVLDFWGTWCPTCLRSMPKTVEMANKYKDQGLVVIGVHQDGKGQSEIPRLSRRFKMEFPHGIDDGRKSEKAFKVSFWPTYVVIDGKGIVRAAGLSAGSVERVVRTLLKENQPEIEAAESSVPAAWLERRRDGRRTMPALEALPAAPPINASHWLNSPSLQLSDLRGEVVLLDFWATWCGPCLRGIPKMNSIQEKYADRGLRVIGVCHPRGADRMATVVNDRGIRYPVCALPDKTVLSAYSVDGFPDYYLIDRSGRVRVADCDGRKLEEAIKALLAEDVVDAG